MHDQPCKSSNILLTIIIVVYCRRVAKDDMKRICRATGATMVVSLGDMEGGETFDPSWLGSCSSVTEGND